MPKRLLPLALVLALVVTAGTTWFVLRPSGADVALVGPRDRSVVTAEQARVVTGAATKRVTLTAAPARVRIGDELVETWAFNGTVPGPEIRLAAGDVLQATVVNRLPQDLSMHWHGIALRNDMDGVPGVTQEAIAPGESFTYEFVVPDSGTYWYHPHTGVQLDRGLYGPLVVADRGDGATRDATLLLDDWTDGMGETPDEVLARLSTGSGSSGHDMGDMGGMDHGSMPMGDGADHGSMAMGGEDTGDVMYPAYLVNGRVESSPATTTFRPGEQVRLRLVNVGSDTAFKVAVPGTRLQVVATDGFPVVPVTVDTLTIAMGERYDVLVTLPRSGGLPVVAVADGKGDRAVALLRVGAGQVQVPAGDPTELRGKALRLRDLRADASVALPAGKPDRTYRVTLRGAMADYDWAVRAPRSDGTTMPVREGERVRLVLDNPTMMAHPMHLHGHTFQVVTGAAAGPRKDTVLVPSMGSVTVDLVADNPGQWMLHCHNIYHAEVGMMTQLSYVR